MIALVFCVGRVIVVLTDLSRQARLRSGPTQSARRQAVLRADSFSGFQHATEACMLIVFTCENCGKRFQVDERSQGKRGRCSHCGHVMRIPRVEAAEHRARPAAAASPRTPMRRTAAQPRPSPLPAQSALATAHGSRGDRVLPLPNPPRISPRHRTRRALTRPYSPLASPVPGTQQPHANEPHVRFELLDDDADPASIVPVSPEIAARSARDRRVPERSPRLQGRGRSRRAFLFSGCETRGPRAGCT